MASGFDDEDYKLHRWAVRLSCLSVIGNHATHADGTRYTYLALDIGPLYYYPSMLGRGYLLGWDDSLIDDVEALRTVRSHHISLCYLPELSPHQLDVVLTAMNTRVRAWIDNRFKPESRLEDFVVYRRTLLLDVPYQLGASTTGIHVFGNWVTLRLWTPAEIRAAYFERRFGDTWVTVAGHFAQRDPNGLRDILALAANNQRRYEEALGVVRLTHTLPIYNTGYTSVAEWPDWICCFLDGTDSYRLEEPSEMADLIYFVLLTWRTLPDLRQFHRYFGGTRTIHFKVQTLSELHVTPAREADGSIAVRFTCPRIEAVLAPPPP